MDVSIVAEAMFVRVERRARTLMLRSFSSFAPFIEAVEYVTLHFVQVCVSILSLILTTAFC